MKLVSSLRLARSNRKVTSKPVVGQDQLLKPIQAFETGCAAIYSLSWLPETEERGTIKRL